MTTADAYREGLAYGRRMALTDQENGRTNHEFELRFAAKFTANRVTWARALGELRGYRQAQP